MGSDLKQDCRNCHYSQEIGLKESHEGKEVVLICTRDGLLAEKVCMYYQYEPGTE
jgi:hypothetical protein